MSINIVVVESVKQVIAGIPENLIVRVDQPCTVFYTVDDTTPDPTGMSITTLIMETEPSNHFEGLIFLPKNNNFVILNILAVGVPDTNIGTFHRGYGLDGRKIGIGRPGIDKSVSGGTGYINTPNANVTSDGFVITSDGYTEGFAVAYSITKDGYDGYIDGYNIATSGQVTAIPAPIYDHVTGYDEYGNISSTTTLTPAQELNLTKLSDRGEIFIDDGNGLFAKDGLQNIDPRSSTIKDSSGDQLEVVPVEDTANSNYSVDGNSIDDNFDNGPDEQTTPYTSGGIFNPHAAYIEIDGRIDGYINGHPIQPGDRVIINKPYGELRYSTKREDLGDALRTTTGYISGGLVCPIYDYNKGQAAFYYWDNHDYRWVTSLQTITSPKYEIFTRRNGVVIGQVFRWIVGRRVMLPG